MKTDMLKYIPAVLMTAFAALSCSDFLEETSQDEIKPTTANDYRELIAGEIYNRTNEASIHIWLDIMTDDCEEFARSASMGVDTRNTGFGYFTWQQNPELQIEGTLNNDGAWSHYYHQILVSNMILYDIDNLAGTAAEKSLVKAEARMIRAYAYYMLVNLYGEPYDPATASTALGVPVNDLVGSENVRFQRASVQDIYDIIVEDCTTAIGEFIAGGDNNSIYRWNLNAARVFLGRVYLYMHNWDDAIACVNELFTERADLWNLNDKANEGDETADLFFLNSRNPEILFSYGYYYINYFATGARGAYPASAELQGLYQEGDLRYGTNDGAYIRRQGSLLSFMGGGRRYVQYKYEDPQSSLVHGRAIRTAEAYLIRAEAYANKADSYTLALNDLNTLRRHRFDPTHYTDLSGLNQQQTLEAVKLERRLEMCFEQLRWFDLRRWDRPRIVHTYTPDVTDASTMQYFVLQENDPAYTLSIPRAVLEQDSDLQDIYRPARTPEATAPSTGDSE